MGEVAANLVAYADLRSGSYTEADVGCVAALASAADETPEGRSIVAAVAKRTEGELPTAPAGGEFIPFSAQTRMSGINLADGRKLVKGAPDTVVKHVQSLGGAIPGDLDAKVRQIGAKGATPLVVADGRTIVGLVALEDVLKADIRERVGQLRKMGLRTVMITGDNQVTAEAIAEQAGVDDFVAEATPEVKLAYLQRAE